MECNSSDLAGPTARRNQQRDRRKCGQPTTKKTKQLRPGPPQADHGGREPAEQRKTGHRPVPVLSRSAKTSFPWRGPLRCAAWPFPAQNPKELDGAVPGGLPLELLGAATGLPSARSLAESPVPGSFRQHTREGTRPSNKGNGSPHPFPKKEKHRKSLYRPVAAVAGCFAPALPSGVAFPRAYVCRWFRARRAPVPVPPAASLLVLPPTVCCRGTREGPAVACVPTGLGRRFLIRRRLALFESAPSEDLQQAGSP
jgi:hypothetical protein